MYYPALPSRAASQLWLNRIRLAPSLLRPGALAALAGNGLDFDSAFRQSEGRCAALQHVETVDDEVGVRAIAPHGNRTDQDIRAHAVFDGGARAKRQRDHAPIF